MIKVGAKVILSPMSKLYQREQGLIGHVDNISFETIWSDPQEIKIGYTVIFSNTYKNVYRSKDLIVIPQEEEEEITTNIEDIVRGYNRA
jgi:hypothetical protein